MEQEHQMKKRHACSIPLYRCRFEFLINFMGYTCVHAELTKLINLILMKYMQVDKGVNIGTNYDFGILTALDEGLWFR
jgi:hypothetical protein